MLPHKLSRVASSNAGSKTFLKYQENKHVLLLLDNTSAVAYINNLGETVSTQATKLARELWMWCLECQIHLIADNVRTDTESRQMKDRSDWMLNPSIFQLIMRLFPYLEVNLFATRLTSQLPRFFSWRPDPLAEVMDAFLQDWSLIKGYANPPWNLVGKVLTKVQDQAAYLALVAPIWPSQPWYPKLLGLLLSATPLRIDPQEEAIVEIADQVLEVTPPLAVWPISGNTTRVRDFQVRLQPSCYPHGERSRHSHMTHCVKKWIGWCSERQADPVSGPIEVVNFLAFLHGEGSQFWSLNSYRSAIASMHTPIDGMSIGQHPLVARLLKGAFWTCPPLPRYTGTWDVNQVLNHLHRQGPFDPGISLKSLSQRTVMLLALMRPSRSV